MEDTTLKKIHKLEIEILDEVVRICNSHNLNYFLIAGSLIGVVRHEGFIPWDDDLDIAMPRQDYEKFITICKEELNERFIIDSYETSEIYYRLAAKVRIKNTIYMEKDLRNYKGNHGIWIDILPLDYSTKEKSITLSLQAAIKSTLQVAIMEKQKVDISEKSLWKKIIVKLVSKLPMKILSDWQTKAMKYQNNKKNVKYMVNLASKYGYKKQTFLIEKYLPAKEMLFEQKKYKVPNDYDFILKTIYGDYMKIPPIEKQEIHNPVKIRFEDGEEIIYEEV